ncbi:sialin-like [Sitophilus oryzae]|uniref:Sialin-like n=1 Tax=Sitophilus oryzae TaxID=7048 RepID=A0A6J2YM78_SITOR|nr:sialin-like [Sitophilus oryzae]
MREVEARGGFGKISSRYLLAILGSIGLGIVYGLKVNFHVAIVSMVNHTAVGGSEHGDAGEDGPFEWPKLVQGLLLSSYFWGYMVAELPGGRIAELFSAKWVMFFSVAINIIAALLSPLMAELHYGGLFVMRIAQGIGGGVSFPGMHVMLAHWAPPNERSVMSSIVYAGTALGTVVFMLVSGLIAGKIGWQYIFYLEGAISAAWLLLWGILVADTPAKQIYVDKKTLKSTYLFSTENNSKITCNLEKLKMPWKAVFLSPAFLAILIAHTCSNWGWYMVLIELPLYMKSVLKFKISENAVLTALPFFCMWLFSMVLSKLLDSLRGRNKITTTTARKLATGCASFIPLICFVALCYVDNRGAAVALMTIAITAIGGMFCGFLSNHIDIAPNYAGTLMALTNTVATIPGIAVPIFVSELTKKDDSISSWRIIFWVTIVLYIVEIVVYMAFGSGEEQKWNRAGQIEVGESQPLKSQISPTTNKSDKI